MQLQQLSPADSLLSAPADNYPSLFPESIKTPDSSMVTIGPMEMMTPQSYIDDKTTPVDQLDDSTDATDKKSTKKRKSWGQVLPEPKTNLPPRKRAKTADEKEQRRVERVLRNRRAAQSSRERKRLEVEALEKRNQELESLLLSAQKANLLLVDELNKFRRDSGVVTRTSCPLDSLRDNQVSLSPELFSSQDGHQLDTENNDTDELADDILLNNPTVDPVALSPELTPIDEVKTESPPSDQTEALFTDLTQHPAEVLSDLQCHSSVEMPQSRWSQTLMSPLLVWILQLRMLLLSASTIASTCQRPLTQIALSSKAGFSLRPTPRILTTIISLVTLAPSSPAKQMTFSTSTSFSATRQTTPPSTLSQRATLPPRAASSTSQSTSLRFKFLRKILASSPSLARPLMDATMVALRLVSERGDNRVRDLQGDLCGTRAEACELTRCLGNVDLPSKETLIALLWVLQREAQKWQGEDDYTTADESDCTSDRKPDARYTLSVEGMDLARRNFGVVI